MIHVNDKINVLIVDDHKLFRQSLKIMISRWPGIDIVGETGDWQESLRLVERLRPTVTILDISMPGLGGLELTPRIRRLVPESRILILSMHDDANHVYRAFKAGCNGFVLKSDSAEELEQAIRTVASGKTYLSPAISSVFIATVVNQDRLHNEHSLYGHLTQREQEIARLLVQRYATTDIAATLCISPKTVRVHITNMMRKLNCTSREALVAQLAEMLAVSDLSGPPAG